MIFEMNYAEKVMDAVQEALNRFQKISEQKEKLDVRYGAEEIGSKGYSVELQRLNDQRNAVLFDSRNNIAQIGRDYAAAVNEKANNVDASMLNDDAKLLELSTFNPTQEQFEILVNKNRDNVLVTQMLQSFQEKRPYLSSVYVETPAARISKFDDYTAKALFVLSNPDSLQAAFFLDGKYTPNNTEI